MPAREPRALAVLVVAAWVAGAGCGGRSGLHSPPPPDAGPRDAGMDGGRDGAPPLDVGPDGPAPCVRCDDGVLCNGAELCAADGTCLPGAPETCDDLDPCTADRCDPAADVCAHLREERDEDGDGVTTCAGDCDDGDPTVSPLAPEVCDMQDDDCDLAVDEGVLSPCFDCRPGCRRALVPEPGADWDLSDSAGLEVGPDGSVRLGSTRTETFSAWIANYLYGTVTRLDTRTGAQVGEYDSVLRDGTNGASPPGEECETERRGGNCPSRTAVDLRGAVYVANRAFFAQGTLTKIAGFEEDCVDRDGDGAIDTSRDLDGDGVIERSVRGEFLGQADECILWTVDVGGYDDIPRAVAIDAEGHVWVGLNQGHEAWELDPNDGSVLRVVRLPTGGTLPFGPYGAAVDGRNRVWFASAGTGRVVAVDTVTGELVDDTTAVARDRCSSSYGIAVDENDNVWLAGFQCPWAYRYDPGGRRWMAFSIPDAGGTRGIAADGRGRIYVAASHTYIRFGAGGLDVGDAIARVTVLNARTGAVERTLGTAAAPLPGAGSTGVGLDSSGAIWLVNQGSSTATRIDPVTFAAREYPTGTAPYTYSDFTGYALRTFTAPNGYLRTVIDGCAVGPTEWERVDWTASAPPGTRIELRVRTAGTAAELRTRPWSGPFTARPSDLVAPPGPVGSGRLMELELQLFSDGGSASPSVAELSVQLNCPSGG